MILMTINLKKIHASPIFASIAIILFGSSILFAGQVPKQGNFAEKEAIAHLKSTGQYESLTEAIQAARYSMRGFDVEKVWAQNLQNDLSATFDSEGVHLDVRCEDEKHYQSSWRLESVGNNQVVKGDLQYGGQRVEILRSGLTEWFVNRPTGLEHGFTLTHRPETAGEQLQLTVAIEGDLKIMVSEDGQHAELQDKTTETKVLDYDKLRVWDATGRELTARMSVLQDGAKLQFEVEDSHASYPLTIDPTFAQEAFLKADNAEADDNFGFSVAVSGDTVVVGAPRESSSPTGGGTDNSVSAAGAAYVFFWDGIAWVQQAFLKADNGTSLDQFGNSVAVSEDIIAVGAHLENSGAIDSGAVYVFVRSGTTWSQQAFLKANNAEFDELFGISVALSGDRLVIGASREDSSATGGPNDNSESRSGAAYVFERSDTIWSQQAILKAANAGANDLFGTSVAMSGNTIVVGAIDEESSATGDGSDNDASDSGAAYVFVRDGMTWSQQAFLKASNADANDEFGTSVAVSGNILVVGAPREDSDATDPSSNASSTSSSGAAYVFVRNGTTWSEQAVLKADNVDDGDRFGHCVAISQGRVFVSANREGSNQGNSGAVYTFRRSGPVWNQREFIKASNVGFGDEFGFSIAASESTMVVGAFSEDSSSADNPDDDSQGNAGAGFILIRPESPDPEVTTIEVDSSLSTVTLTWNSIADATYRVDYSQDLSVWIEDLAFGIPHDANGDGLTTQEIDLGEANIDGSERLFLRVVEE